jgi:hypothetical protein
VDRHGDGGEVYNFYPFKGNYYGYVTTAGNSGTLNIDNLGAPRKSDRIDGVDVIWTAARPDGSGTVIVGWYRRATVYRRYADCPEGHPLPGNTICIVIGSVANARLLPRDGRLFVIPRAKRGYMGQSNVWFAHSAPPAFIAKVRQYMQTGELPSLDRTRRQTSKAGLARRIDAVRRAKVERAAIGAVWKKFSSLGYLLTSVEKENCGWDIDATCGPIRLRLEAKGLSGEFGAVELTPNEYRYFRKAERSPVLGYRLCVVSRALSNRLHVYVFAHNQASRKWVDEGEPDLVLVVTKIESARLSTEA